MNTIKLIVFILFACSNVSEDSNIKNYETPSISNPIVTTVHSNVSKFDGFLIDTDGSFIAASGYNKRRVFRINSDGSENTMLDSLGGPVYIAKSPNGEIYISNFASHTVVKLTHDQKVVEVANNLNAPAPLTFDSKGNLYIGDYGKNYQGSTVTKVTADGAKSYYVESESSITPIGLAFGPNGEFYIANQPKGEIYVYKNGRLSLLVTIPGGHIAHMLILKGNLYLTSAKMNKLYKVTLDGKVTTFAGTGEVGNSDGNGLSATFTAPNGLTTDGKSLYVASGSDINRTSQVIRKISF